MVNNNKTSDLKSIQFLRGIAAFLVVLHHCGLAMHGDKGVHIFFIISGFIIPYSMSKYNYRYRDVKDFMVKRLVRIEPPYIASIVLALFLAYTTTTSPWYSGPAFTIDWPNVAGHLAYMNAFTGSPWLNAAYWTLAIEFEFYLLMALLFPLLWHSNIKVMYATFMAIVMSIFIKAGASHIFSYVPFFTFGIALFLYKTDRISLKGLLVLLGIVTAVTTIYYSSIYLALSFATMLSILFIRSMPKPLLFLGTISYSMYLIHGFLITRFLGLAHRFAPGISEVWLNVFCLAFIVFCSYLYYRAIERPFQLLSKKKGLKKNTEIPSPELITPALEQVPVKAHN